MSQYFPKPKSLGANVKFDLNLYYYETKKDIKMQQDLIYRF